MYQMQGQVESAQVVTIPAPFGGWNAKDPLPMMAPQDAITLENLFPGTNTVDIRRGNRLHTDTGSNKQIETLATHITTGGVEKLVGCVSDAIYNVSAAVSADITGAATITSARWQTLMMNHTLLLFNGVDQPLKWTGSGNVASNAITGTDPALAALDDATLIQATSYRNRCYAIQKDTLWLWYGGAAAIAGVFTPEDLSTTFRKGGYLLWAATWTFDDGGGTDDRLVLCSSEGEILIYQGSYPGGDDWARIGQFFLPKPLGRRSFFNLDSDVMIITEGGVIPLSAVMSTGQKAGTYARLTDKIQNAFRLAAESWGSSFGWEGFVYPKGPYLAINVPRSSATDARQYVMNLLTGSWCQFIDQPANCWAIFNGKPYFARGDSVFVADTGTTDNGNRIPIKLKTAFNYCGLPGVVKQFSMTQLLMLANSADVEFLCDADVDFAQEPVIGTITNAATGGTAWDVGEWDEAAWDTGNRFIDDWYSIDGLGRCVAIKIEGNVSGLQCAFNSLNVLFVVGGVM